MAQRIDRKLNSFRLASTPHPCWLLSKQATLFQCDAIIIENSQFDHSAHDSRQVEEQTNGEELTKQKRENWSPSTSSLHEGKKLANFPLSPPQ